VRRVVFVEIDESPAAMTRQNLVANGWSDRGEVVRGDVLDVARARPGDAGLIVCNPPYVAPGRGHASPSQSRARMGELAVFVEAARHLAGHRARVCVVYPAAELVTLLSTLELRGLAAKRLRLVHSRPEAPARVALVEARAGRVGGLVVHPPLVERTESGYTPEMQALFDRD
jgi:tRNA1Val (adenine37-N6)-methyltransferase